MSADWESIAREARTFLDQLTETPIDEAIEWACAIDADHFYAALPEVSPKDRRRLTVELAQFALEKYRLAAEEPGVRLSLILKRALLRVKKGGVTTIRDKQVVSNEEGGGLSPRFSSGIPKLDDRTGGGFYGMVALAGDPGTMKSAQALTAALNAAVAGWRVVYYDCELGDYLFRARLSCAVRRNPLALTRINPSQSHDLVVQAASPQIRFRDVSRLKTVDDLIEDVDEWVEYQDDRLLVVFDSASKIAKLLGMNENGDYFSKFRHLDILGMVFEEARKQSAGQIASIHVCETNRGAGIGGRDLEFTSDLDIRFREKDGLTEVTIAKSRESSGGKCGEYTREWKLCTLREAGTWGDDAPAAPRAGESDDEVSL